MATKETDNYVNQPTAAPSNKVQNAAIGGAITVLILAAVEYFTQVPVSSEVASSLTLLITVLFGYFTRDKVQIG